MRRSEEIDFERFVVARRVRLRATAYLLCGDWSDAEDLTQVALLKLYGAWARVRSAGADAYVHRILVNAYIDQYRQRARRPETLMPDTPEVRTDGGELVGRDDHGLLELMRGLSAQQRVAITLRFWNDMPLDEVAAMMGISRNTAKTHLARGLSILRVQVGTLDEA